MQIPKNKTIGFTAGAFDLCHAGHMLMFKDCKTVCDYLIVALHRDPSVAPKEYRGKKKNVPIMSIEERKIILESIKYIDEIVEYDTEEDLYALLKEIQPDIRIIGADWRDKKYTGHDLDIVVYFNHRDHHYSSTELRQRIYEAENKRNHSNNPTAGSKTS